MMKKLLLILISTILIPLHSQAQNAFAPVGAEWWYNGNSYDYFVGGGGTNPPPYSCWSDHIIVSGDTIINGKSCQIVVGNRMERGPTDTNAVHQTLQGKWYVYDNTDTVFIYKDSISDFVPLYILNVQAGDTICMDNPIGNNPASFCYVVDSIYTITVGNVSVKTVTTLSILLSVGGMTYYNWGGGNHGGQKGSYSSSLGVFLGKNSSFFPSLYVPLADGATFYGFPYGQLRCYINGANNFHFDNAACDTLICSFPLSINEINVSKEIIIYPNPANDAIYIKSLATFSKNSSCYLQDCTGKRMTDLVTMPGKSDIKIPTAHLADGLYILILQQDGQRFQKKVVVRH